MDTPNATQHISNAPSVLCFLSLLSLFISTYSLYRRCPSSTLFLPVPFLPSNAPCKKTKLSLPFKCIPSMSSISKLTSFTCISPLSAPPHVTTIPHCTCAPSTATIEAYRTCTSPVSQCLCTATGCCDDRFTARFPAASIRTQLSLMSPIICLHSSSPAGCLIAVGTTSLGSRRSTLNGEQRNQSLTVSVS